MMKTTLRLLASATLALLLSARPLCAEIIYAIANQAPATALVTFDSAAPNALLSGVFLSDLQPNETILGIDFPPNFFGGGVVYGLGSTSRLYGINTTTGVANSLVGTFTPNLNGFSFGFDANPVTNHLSIVSETGQNLDLNPGGGAVASPNVFYASGDPNFGVHPNVVDLAYSNNVVGASSTVLYGIDTALDILVRENPTTGALTTVGPLGVNVDAAGGFDISGKTGIAYAVLLPVGGSHSSLFTINLVTGSATPVGVIDGGLVITAMTVAPVPEPAAMILAGSAAVLPLLIRRRK